MTEIDGGKVSGKDILKVGGGLVAIGAGIYEISTGIGASKGAKDIVTVLVK